MTKEGRDRRAGKDRGRKSEDRGRIQGFRDLGISHRPTQTDTDENEGEMNEKVKR